jgi:hypothetical protein
VFRPQRVFDPRRDLIDRLSTGADRVELTVLAQPIVTLHSQALAPSQRCVAVSRRSRS